MKNYRKRISVFERYLQRVVMQTTFFGVLRTREDGFSLRLI
jgi:hypothetical protein